MNANTTEEKRTLDIDGFFGILSVACAISGWVFSPVLSLAAIFIGFYALTRKNKIDSVLGIVGIVMGLITLMYISYYQNLDYGPAPKPSRFITDHAFAFD